MILSALLLAANLVGSLIMEMTLGSFVYLEIIILGALLVFSALIMTMHFDRNSRVWGLLVAFHSLAIANATFLFFGTGMYLMYILLLVINLIGLLRAANKENRPSNIQKVRLQTVPLNTPQSQVVDLPQEAPKIVPYDRAGEIETYDLLSHERSQRFNSPVYDNHPVIEPTALYNTDYNPIENGAAKNDKRPELVVRLPKPAKKAKKAKTVKKAKKAKAVKKAKKTKTNEKVVKIIHVSKPKKTVKKAKKPAQSKLAKKHTKSQSIRVIRRPDKTAAIAGQEKNEPIAAEPGRRRLILDL